MSALEIRFVVAGALLVLAVLVLIGLGRNAGMGLAAVTLAVIMVLSPLAPFATGAFLSFEKAVGAFLLTIHKPAPTGAAGSGVLLICLRLGAKA